MARRVFFSFHYQRDIFRVNVVRNSNIVEGCAAAGFQDGSIWEEAKRHGPDAVKRLINRGLEGTSVTAVLIGSETSKRQYVDYEIEKSIERGNGLLGIYIHNIAIPNYDLPGLIPYRLAAAGAPVYHWDRTKFGEWVEDAYKKAETVRPSVASLMGLTDFYQTPKPPQEVPASKLLMDALLQAQLGKTTPPPSPDWSSFQSLIGQQPPTPPVNKFMEAFVRMAQSNKAPALPNLFSPQSPPAQQEPLSTSAVDALLKKYGIR